MKCCLHLLCAEQEGKLRKNFKCVRIHLLIIWFWCPGPLPLKAMNRYSTRDVEMDFILFPIPVLCTKQNTNRLRSNKSISISCAIRSWRIRIKAIFHKRNGRVHKSKWIILPRMPEWYLFCHIIQSFLVAHSRFWFLDDHWPFVHAMRITKWKWKKKSFIFDMALYLSTYCSIRYGRSLFPSPRLPPMYE